MDDEPRNETVTADADDEQGQAASEAGEGTKAPKKEGEPEPEADPEQQPGRELPSEEADEPPEVDPESQAMPENEKAAEQADEPTHEPATESKKGESKQGEAEEEEGEEEEEEEESETAKKEHQLIEAALAEEEDEEWTPETQIVVLKTQVGQERRVAENLAGKAKRFGIPIMSLLAPQELRGYVFIETPDVMALEKGIRGVSYARALIKDPDGQPRDTPFTEIQHFLTPVSAVAKIGENDIVELVSGPFRGEKAKVTRVDDAREEITVELIESMVPIPITVKGEHVRVLEKGS